MSDTDVMYKATLDVSGVSSGAHQMNGIFGSMGSSAGMVTSAINAMAVAAVAAGAALVGMAAVGVSTFMDLEASAGSAAAKTVDINGKSTEEIKAQYDDVKAHVMKVSRELGAATVFDPVQVSEAFGALAAGGQDVSKIGNEQLRPMLDLASSEMTYGLGPATSLVMTTMSQFGLGMQDTGRIADVLAKGAAGTKASLADFAGGLKDAGPVAKATGVSLEETTAMIGKLTDRGFTGAEAGNALKSAMIRLGNPTKEIKDGLASMGMTYADVDPRQRTFLQSLAAMKEHGAGVYEIGKIFGLEGAAIVESLASMTGEVQGFTTELENSKGVARTMADLGLDSVTMDLEAAKGAASDLVIGIGERLAPSIRAGLQAFSAFAPTIQEFIDAAFDLDFGKIASILSDVGNQIINYFKNIDYKSIGESLHMMLVSGWEAAVGLFQSFLSSDVSLTGAFSVIQDVFGPTFEHIFNNLKITGLETYLSLGDGVVKMANNIGSVLTGAINIAIQAFARLAGAADEALGGAISKLLGLQTGSTPTGTTSTSTSWIDPNALYKNTATNTEIKGSSISNMAVESDYIKLDSTGSTDISLQTGTVHTSSLPVSAGTVILSTSGTSLKSDVLGEMKLHTMAWGEDGAGMGYAGTSDEQKQLATDFKDVKENTDSDGWLGGAIKSIAKGDEQVVGSGEFAGTKAEIEEIPAAYKEVAETTQRKTSNDLDFGFTKLSGGLDELAKIGKDGLQATAEDNPLYKAIVDKWGLKWTDAPLFSETPYGQEIKAEIAKLSQLEEIKDTISKVGGENKEELAKVDSTIAATKEAINNQLAESASGDKTQLSEGMYYGDVLDPKYVWQDFVNTEGGYGGPTKLYPGYEDPALAAQQEAAAINDKYGIGGLGSIGSVTIDTTTGAIPVHVESSAPGVLTTQDTTSQKATGVTDQTASSSQQLIQSVTQGANNIINTIKSQGTNDRTTMLTSANVVSAAMSSNAAYLSYSISAAASSIVNALYEVFGTMQSFASGGYVDRPTLAIIGDAPGGEYIVPASEYGMTHTTALRLDASSLQTQVNAAIGNVSVSPIYVPAQVVVDIDSSQVQSAVHQALAIELDNLRL